jgi:hypothetical protein
MHTNTVPRLAANPPRSLPRSLPAELYRSLLGAVTVVVVDLDDGALAADWIRAGIKIDQPIWGLRDGLQLPASPTPPFGCCFAAAMTLRSIRASSGCQRRRPSSKDPAT